MIIKHLAKEAFETLSNLGFETAALDVEVLLGHALGKESSFVFLNPEYEIPQSQVELFRSFIERRAKKEPIAHIIGYKHFWKGVFQVSDKTLIPRPDTETLVEAVLDIYNDKAAKFRILDLGTGTGCILISLLQEFPPNAYGVGVDIDEEVINLAERNSKANNVSNRVEFLKSDWFEGVSGEFDLIVSNPPYIAVSEVLSDEVFVYEPKTALFADDNGFKAYEIIASNLKTYLKPNGYAFFEIGYLMAEGARALFERAGYNVVEIRRDIGQRDRVVVIRNTEI